jgi:SagB-type dehydrogenase family enzyme
MPSEQAAPSEQAMPSEQAAPSEQAMLSEQLSEQAGPATGSAGGPSPLLITITARFRRANHKLSGIAYASVLKDVGALQHTLAQIATAMGLDTRPLALGDADASARILHLDWRSESSVGELLIGSRQEAGTGDIIGDRRESDNG